MFLAWIKSRVKFIIIFILFAAIYTTYFLLYRLPPVAVLPPIMLCTIVGLGIMIYDFSVLRNKHCVLSGHKGIIDVMSRAMPEADSVIEADYQKIIESVKNEAVKIMTDSEENRREMIDYYTMWVHQIKTPISSMKLTLEQEDSQMSWMLSSELLHIEQYVEMVLAYLRLGSDRTDYIIKEVRLDDMIRPSIKRFADEFINRKLSLKYESTDVSVITDEKWFSFAFEQILSNSLKYTRSGEIRIYMRDDVTLCIEDTGIGIAAEDLPRIFEKGYTGYNGRIERSASGLGLYLTKRVFDKLRHSITVNSSVGHGTAVCIGLDRYCLEEE